MRAIIKWGKRPVEDSRDIAGQRERDAQLHHGDAAHR